MGQSAPFPLYITPHYWTITAISFPLPFSFKNLDSCFTKNPKVLIFQMITFLCKSFDLLVLREDQDQKLQIYLHRIAGLGIRDVTCRGLEIRQLQIAERTNN
ncbi:hypothetical protein L1987_19809 [Smallanthus sonchifolius]|uniref:Uncharacterized protein n=1 Tax=Smallanthus sonchifolius TaxID=185202 RepID=A0ACB9IQI5_9ASTR|nr:hypothetical protein L1987_19809 [Smallanthus sonchifolius]